MEITMNAAQGQIQIKPTYAKLGMTGFTSEVYS